MEGRRAGRALGADVDVIAKEKLGRAVGKALGIDMAMILDA